MSYKLLLLPTRDDNDANDNTGQLTYAHSVKELKKI